MLAACLILFLRPDVGELDRLAQARDVTRLTSLAEPLPAGVRNPFAVLRTGGAYGVGEKGWHAAGAEAPDHRSYTVLTTPMTTEDVGEIVVRRSGSRYEFVPEADDLGVRIVSHSFAVSFAPADKRAIITDHLRFRRTSTASGAFLFRMSPCYRVKTISDESGALVPFSQAGGVVFVARPTKMQFALTVAYEGVVDNPQFAGSIGADMASLTNDYWYPMIARKPAPYDIAVRVPKAWTVVAQGVRTSNQESGDEHVVSYRMDLPTSFYSLSAGLLKSSSKTVGDQTFSAWSPQLSAQQLDDQIAFMQPVVKFYRDTFGTWPFKGYGALDCPSYGGGALEAYSYATYGTGLPYEDAHEPSHTLFGGVLVNDYLQSFWNESFANYADRLYQREVPKGNVAERRQVYATQADLDPEYEAHACWDTGADAGPAASTIGYGKGSLVLGMLEQIVGKDRLVAAVKRWIATNKPSETTGWPDFEKAMTFVAPKEPISRFFDGWIRGKKVPTLKVLQARRTASGVTLKLSVQPSGFILPVETLVTDASGHREWATTTVDARQRTVEYDIKTRLKATTVCVDPWRRLLRHPDVSGAPAQLGMHLEGLRPFVDAAHPDWLAAFERPKSAPLGTSAAGRFVIGHPDTVPAMRSLCAKAGFAVKGDHLTYRGTTIDLRHGGAIALIDLGKGAECAIGLGTCRYRPNFGQSKLIVFDELGRFLRGEAAPVTSGPMTAKL